MKSSNTSLFEEKKKVEDQLLQAKNYTRKLESKITSGNKGGVIAEVNRSLKLQNDFLRSQNEKLLQDFQT